MIIIPGVHDCRDSEAAFRNWGLRAQGCGMPEAVQGGSSMIWPNLADLLPKASAIWLQIPKTPKPRFGGFGRRRGVGKKKKSPPEPGSSGQSP